MCSRQTPRLTPRHGQPKETPYLRAGAKAAALPLLLRAWVPLPPPILVLLSPFPLRIWHCHLSATGASPQTSTTPTTTGGRRVVGTSARTPPSRALRARI